MADRPIERALSRAGILLVLLALVTGLAIPAFTNPRQALAAHVSGIMSGLLLVAVASLWSRRTLSIAQQSWAIRLAIGGAYANLAGSLNGNAAYWSGSTQTSINAQSTSTDQYVTTRAAVADVGLYDRVSGQVAWRGELKVSSQGVLATDGAFIRSAAARVAKALRTQRLVR